MMLSRSRLIPAAVVAAGIAVTQIASAAPPAASQGGVSVSPASLAVTARAGATATATVSNTTAGTLAVTVTARPWRQAKSGAVSADRSRRLRGVTVRARAFSLAPGASRTVRVRLGRVPAAGSLFGALDVIGKPARQRRGVNVNYRLIGRLRFNPQRKRHRLAAGKAAVKRKQLRLLVRNRGNTVDPVTGRVTISGPGGGRSSSIGAQSILPKRAVRVPLASTRGLRPGTYRATISLSQGGRTRLTTQKRFRIR
jgi:hypothetical protein